MRVGLREVDHGAVLPPERVRAGQMVVDADADDLAAVWPKALTRIAPHDLRDVARP